MKNTWRWMCLGIIILCVISVTSFFLNSSKKQSSQAKQFTFLENLKEVRRYSFSKVRGKKGGYLASYVGAVPFNRVVEQIKKEFSKEPDFHHVVTNNEAHFWNGATFSDLDVKVSKGYASGNKWIVDPGYVLVMVQKNREPDESLPGRVWGVWPFNQLP